MKKLICLLFVFLLCACGPKDNVEQTPAIAGKTYFNTVDEFDNAEHSKIWFGKDGSFVMKDCFFDGYYELSGKWSIEKGVVTLNVENGKFDKVIFEVKDDDSLTLKSTLTGSSSDTLFTTTKPEISTPVITKQRETG